MTTPKEDGMSDKQYVVISGGDGYQGEIVSETQLDAAVHDVFCSCKERLGCAGADYVHAMRTEEWDTNYHFGPVVFKFNNLEDGWVTIALLTKPPSPPVSEKAGEMSAPKSYTCPDCGVVKSADTIHTCTPVCAPEGRVR